MKLIGRFKQTKYFFTQRPSTVELLARGCCEGPRLLQGFKKGTRKIHGVTGPSMALTDLCPPPGPACPEGWIEYRGKCYYFSEVEGNWTYIQRHCSSFGASLAGIDSEQELMFLLRHKDIHDHWIGLWREQGQPWKWTNGTKFNDLFQIRGGGDCAYLNDEKGVSSSRCYMERRWICSKPEVYVTGKGTAVEGSSK
uniref:C-type lectin domain-containing protein n=1 Tax=Chelonoidis abingdonii TaxID=106734 RepID=A0A8C0J1U1_CHEAB